MKHMKNASISVISLLALTLSGSTVASAQPVEALPEAAQQNVVAFAWVDPGGAREDLRATHEEWIELNEIERLPELDAVAEDYAVRAITADWDYRDDPAGVSMTDLIAERGEYVQVARFTLEGAEAWSARGMADIPAAPDVPLGLADKQDDNYIYVVLAFGSLPTVY
ncbi:hypothetical protein [Corynebacterium sp. A21]|uniref:hypothetical protein n=1 Tax=Corynebacterium sp. A21 TaxID=3457318 RepID=UPI003FD627FF